MITFLGMFGYMLFMVGVFGNSSQAVAIGVILVVGSIGHVLFVEDEE